MTKIQRHHEDWRALSTINAYRCLIAFGLLGIQLIPALRDLVAITLPTVFASASLLYVCLSAAAIFCALVRWPQAQTQAYAFIAADIAVLSCTMLASSGMVVGLSLLLCVFVGCVGALSSTRGSFSIALLAAAAVFLQESLRSALAVDTESAFLQATILSILFFVVTRLTQVFAQRIRKNQAIVAAHAGTLRNLAELNRRIIEQMEMGAIVLDGAHDIQMANAAAVRMLQLRRPPESGAALQEISTDLDSTLDGWLQQPGAPIPAIELSERTLLPSFSILPIYTGRHADTNMPVLIFLEDADRQNEQARNLKLTALGRLSAGIAHEIRNPLSAISHATQLLGESEHLTDSDRKLLDIIYRHSGRIDGIVEDVLGLSRRKAGQQSQLQLKACLDRIVSEYRQHSENPAKVSMEEIDADQKIFFHADHLHRILFNLCTNAERYARHPGTQLLIRLVGSHNDSGMFCLDIMDNGPGFDTETTHRILEPFYTTGANGTGLGLHVARELCESNGAHLKPIANAHGARFRIIFSTPPNSLNHA